MKTFNDSAESSWSDEEGVEGFDFSVTLGNSDCTNNEAEYMSLIIAMYLTLERLERCSLCNYYPLRYASIDIYGDSNLVIQQMAGCWQARGNNMQKLHHYATDLLKELSGS
jgi:ribonuclease HI